MSEPGPDGFTIDFEVDSEWRKCIYSDSRRGGGGGGGGPGSSRNNSSTSVLPRGGSSTTAHHANYTAPAVGFLSDCNQAARQVFETTLQRARHSISLSLCVRKHNYDNFLWQFVNEGKISSCEAAYEHLPLWTVLLRVRMHRRVSFGNLMRGLQSRLGLCSASENLKFCLDGFYGMPGCGDIFGNHGDGAVPWMEISSQSTADSLQLCDGDIIFVSYSNEKLECLARARKQNMLSRASFAQADLAQADSPSSLSNCGGRGSAGLVLPRSHSAVPLAGLVQPPSLHRALRLSRAPQPQLPIGHIHSGQPLHLAAETAVESHFSLAVNNHYCDDDLDPNSADISAIFTKLGTELAPDALERLLRLQSSGAPAASVDFVRVRYPGCPAGLALALSPELLARLLAESPPGLPQFRQARARAFNLEPRLMAADDAVADSAGLVPELRRFAVALDARLGGARCDVPEPPWTLASVGYFAVDTFFAAAVTAVYGTDRSHRFQPYAVAAAVRCIEEEAAVAAAVDVDAGELEAAARDRRHRLGQSWEQLYSLHPTTGELAALRPCLHLRRMRDRFLKGSETWESFVRCSICCCLYEEFNAQKAAFWAINYLLANRHFYEDLLAEIQDAGARTAGEGPEEFKRLTLMEIDGLQLLDAFIKEVHRLTSGQFLRFQAASGMVLQSRGGGQAKCRKGSQMAVLLRTLNMNPRLFHDPEAFHPQRFLPAGGDAAPPCLPFGAMSPRRRAGLLKLKLFIIQLLRRCSLRPVEEAPAARVDRLAYGLDVLPWTEDPSFQYRARQLAAAV